MTSPGSSSTSRSRDVGHCLWQFIGVVADVLAAVELGYVPASCACEHPKPLVHFRFKPADHLHHLLNHSHRRHKQMRLSIVHHDLQVLWLNLSYSADHIANTVPMLNWHGKRHFDATQTSVFNHLVKV